MFTLSNNIVLCGEMADMFIKNAKKGQEHRKIAVKIVKMRI